MAVPTSAWKLLLGIPSPLACVLRRLQRVENYYYFFFFFVVFVSYLHPYLQSQSWVEHFKSSDQCLIYLSENQARSRGLADPEL